MSTEAARTRALQRWMLEVVSHFEGIEQGIKSASGLHPVGDAALEAIVPGNDRLSGREQLQIYAYMYFARLIEVMEQEYPSVQELLGAERFAQLARQYLSEQPSAHYNLARLSSGFPNFLIGQRDRERLAPFAAALAQVERAMEELVDEEEQQPLEHKHLAALPIEQWQDARLKPIAALRLLRIEYPVNEFMNALQQGHSPKVPQPCPTLMCVRRQQFQCYREELFPEQFSLLQSLQQGASLGQAIETAASVENADPARMMKQLGSWFEAWSSKGMFSTLQQS
tara:strand:- start:1725 stop:2573 length:849 start_codon:yes stop_codon:yes gene_type:complete